MITESRLTLLQFQADHNGYGPPTVEKMNREGRQAEYAAGAHGPMVTITVSELRQLLTAYINWPVT